MGSGGNRTGGARTIRGSSGGGSGSSGKPIKIGAYTDAKRNVDYKVTNVLEKNGSTQVTYWSSSNNKTVTTTLTPALRNKFHFRLGDL